MTSGGTRLTVAVIGAGISGAACARTLTLAGHSVHVFDKSRGPGGRLATRGVEWIDRRGQARTTRLDHGAVGFTARSADFQTFVDRAVQAGCLTAWAPTLAADSLLLDDVGSLYLPVPDMPALCRHLLDGVAATWSCDIDGLHQGPLGWQLQACGGRLGPLFDVVVSALPPSQAAPLLGPHRLDWARRASVALMQPCWTLMGVADEAENAPHQTSGWSLARPPRGILAWALRNDARPGRERVRGEAHWVLHAHAGWSRQHLEQPTGWIQAHLQAALAEWLGQPVEWRHCVAHRWRYARPQTRCAAPARCWWDASLGLGVCGDFLGGAGVEGSWLSAQALTAALLLHASNPVDAPAASATHNPSRRRVA